MSEEVRAQPWQFNGRWIGESHRAEFQTMANETIQKRCKLGWLH